MAVLGNGTDTGNSIRMPAATSALVGVFPTRGLVSIAGIAPLDWLLDNTGPDRAHVTDAAIALAVMAGEDPARPADYRIGAEGAAPALTRTTSSRDALNGKRFGVPAFILAGAGIPFQGIPAAETASAGRGRYAYARRELPLRPETRAMFMKAIDALRAAGATVVFDDSILPDSFAEDRSRVAHFAYIRDGTEQLPRGVRPAAIPLRRGVREGRRLAALPATSSAARGRPPATLGRSDRIRSASKTNPHAERRRTTRRAGARSSAYRETLDRLQLDGYVYPAIQMPPPDETMPQDGGLSTGPHSDRLGQHDRRAGGCRARGLLPERPALRTRVLRAPLARRRSARLGLRASSRRPISGGRRCWSTRACSPSSASNVRTIQPE